MSSYAEWLIDRARELNDLVEGLQIPETDGVIKTDCDHVLLGKVEVHRDD